MSRQAAIVGAFGATSARRYYDIRTAASAASLPTCANSQTPAPAPANAKANAASHDPEDIEFAMYDDGRLGIFDGDEILIIPPEATIRLGRFLGCFDAHIN